MLLTASPKSRIASHSAGWRVMQLVKDRQSKGHIEGPEQWGAHRFMNHTDKIRHINYQFERLTDLYRLRGRRP
ncbi:hypothetical protein [Arthrobacter sp. ISL-69]|uniref:hypothetical protein n=1 Tax=Arthrobacter sp. ISL-69 TaxID=2819113 RepID=UPI001BE84592|nr:hypothetical protein [Arthrobacter sp. ISL-69]MBT2537261.1 hypothetical protein [Arthrobacter sp. ISL-69]